MKKLFSSLLLLFMAAQAQAAVDCPSQRMLTFAEQVARLDPSFDLDLLDFEFFDGGGLVAGYEYEVEPAYTDGLYSRVDRWTVKASATPGNSFHSGDDTDINLRAGIRFSTEAAFMRFVKDPCRAITLKPYSPRRMPLRAENAIGENFKVGDYFFFRGSSALIASAEILGMLSSGMWGLGVSGHFLMEGFYQLHIVRLNENQIRLKVLGHRGRTYGASARLGWDGDFEVFSVSALNNRLERIVNTTPLKLKANLAKSNIFMLDYVLDLSDSTVAQAFDKVLADANAFKQLRLANPFKDETSLSGMLLLDLSPLEDLFQEDRRNGRVGRLQRNLRTTSSQTSRGWGIDLGNRLFGWEWDRETSYSYMRVKRDDNTADHYLLRTWATESEGRFFYNWTKSSRRSGMRALFETNSELESGRPINIVTYQYQKRNRLSFSKFKGIKLQLKKALPDAVFKSIPWTQWEQGRRDKYTNFGLRYDFIVAPEAILEAPKLDSREIARRFKEHTFQKGLTYTDFFSRSNTSAGSHWDSPKEQFDRSLRTFSRRLAQILNPELSFQSRMSVLSQLRKNRLYQASGFGFLMTLMPSRMQQLYHVDLDLSSNEAKIDFDYGDTQLSELYKKLLTIKAALDDDAFDIIREAQSLSQINNY